MRRPTISMVVYLWQCAADCVDLVCWNQCHQDNIDMPGADYLLIDTIYEPQEFNRTKWAKGILAWV
jgi:hypothetical protein